MKKDNYIPINERRWVIITIVTSVLVTILVEKQYEIFLRDYINWTIVQKYPGHFGFILVNLIGLLGSLLMALLVASILIIFLTWVFKLRIKK